MPRNKKLSKILSGKSIDSQKKYNKELFSKAPDGSLILDNGKLLIHSVKTGNESLALQLLRAGVPSYVTDEVGCNCFFYAARYNRVNLLKILLDFGFLINIPTKMGRTALQIAAFHGHIDSIKFLLKHRADVNLVDSIGMSALHWAAENGHLEAADILLKAGSDISVTNKFGKTPYTLAFANNHNEICELLQENCSIEKMYEFMNNDSMENDVHPYAPYAAVFIPGKTSNCSSPMEVSESNVSRKTWKETTLSQETPMSSLSNDTMKLFEEHGIKLLPIDQSTIIASAIKEGQTAVLTEAGKLALKKTEPNIIRKSTSTKVLSMQPPQKKLKVLEKTKTTNVTSIPPDSAVTPSFNNNTKIIKIDAKELVNLTANKKLIIQSKKIESSRSPETIPQFQIPNFDTTKMSNSYPDFVKELESKLDQNTRYLEELKRQVQASLQIAKNYKDRWESKEREAALYKTQLINLSEILTHFNINYEVIQL